MSGKRERPLKASSAGLPVGILSIRISVTIGTDGAPSNTTNTFSFICRSYDREHFYVLNHRKPKICLSSLSFNILYPEAKSLDTHIPGKYTHGYTLSIVMNDPLKAGLTSWDHFLLLFFFSLALHIHSLISLCSLWPLSIHFQHQCWSTPSFCELLNLSC